MLESLYNIIGAEICHTGVKEYTKLFFNGNTTMGVPEAILPHDLNKCTKV